MQFTPRILTLDTPIHVFCVAAESFPMGVMKAHQTLHELAPQAPGRQYFGISWGGPQITYKAAATEISPGELKQKGLEEFTIRAGNYLAVDVDDFDTIKDVFTQLIKDPRIDPHGYCVELYLDTKKARCMITMEPES